MRTILIEASPWNPTTGAVSAIALAGGGRKAYRHRNRNDWLAGVISEPKFSASIEFDEEGFAGGARPEFGVIEFAPSSSSRLNSVASLMWNGAPIEVFVGDDEVAVPTWSTLIKGTVEAQQVRNGRLLLKIRDASGDLDTPVAKDRFAGTGGLEGDAFVAERLKRRAFGYLSNVEALPLKESTNIFEVADPAFALSAISDVKDMGRSASSLVVVNWAGSAAATLAALEAATAPTGGGAVAPSIACVKWWTQPVGPLTADIVGQLGTGGSSAAARLAQAIISTRASLTISNETAAAGWRSGQAGLFVDNGAETVAQALDRLLRGVSLAWNADANGTIRLSEISLSGPVETLTAIEVSRTRTFKPLLRRRVGFLRNHRLHTDGEISAALRDDAGALLTAGATFGSTVYRVGGAVANQADFETSAGTAAAIAGQGTLATSNFVTWLSQVLGAGKPADYATVGAIAGTDLFRADGTTILTQAEIRTLEGVAASILGQGAFATVNSAAYGSALLTGFAALAARANIRLGDGFIFRNDGSTSLTDALAVTSLGTAAGFTGQGALATKNTIATLDMGDGIVTTIKLGSSAVIKDKIAADAVTAPFIVSTGVQVMGLTSGTWQTITGLSFSANIAADEVLDLDLMTFPLWAGNDGTRFSLNARLLRDGVQVALFGQVMDTNDMATNNQGGFAVPVGLFSRVTGNGSSSTYSVQIQLSASVSESNSGGSKTYNAPLDFRLRSSQLRGRRYSR